MDVEDEVRRREKQEQEQQQHHNCTGMKKKCIPSGFKGAVWVQTHADFLKNGHAREQLTKSKTLVALCIFLYLRIILKLLLLCYDYTLLFIK